MLETALDEESTEHLGHDTHAASETWNVRNGTRTKTVLTEATGHVELDVPRDQAGTFDIAGPRRRRPRRTRPVPAIVRRWDNAWSEFIPFLDYDIENRTMLCSTNAVESLNFRHLRAVEARGHFPTGRGKQR